MSHNLIDFHLRRQSTTATKSVPRGQWNILLLLVWILKDSLIKSLSVRFRQWGVANRNGLNWSKSFKHNKPKIYLEEFQRYSFSILNHVIPSVLSLWTNIFWRKGTNTVYGICLAFKISLLRTIDILFTLTT